VKNLWETRVGTRQGVENRAGRSFCGAAARPGALTEIHGAQKLAKGAVTFSQMAGMVEPMLVNEEVGLVWAPGSKGVAGIVIRNSRPKDCGG